MSQRGRNRARFWGNMVSQNKGRNLGALRRLSSKVNVRILKEPLLTLKSVRESQPIASQGGVTTDRASLLGKGKQNVISGLPSASRLISAVSIPTRYLCATWARCLVSPLPLRS